MMEIAIGRQQAITNYILQALRHPVRKTARQQREYEQVAEDEAAGNLAVCEVAGIFRQDVANVLRSEEQDNGRLADPDSRHAAIGPLEVQ